MENSKQNDLSQQPFSPWQASFDAMSKIWVKMLYLSLVGMAIPLTALEIYQALLAHDLSSTFRELHGTRPTIEFYKYLDSSETFIFRYGGSSVIIVWTTLLTFFCGIGLSLSTLRGRHDSDRDIIMGSLKAFLPRGLLASLAFLALLSLLFFLSASLGAIFQILALVIMALSIATPYLIIEGKQGPVEALISAIRIKYAPKIPGMKLNIFFQLSSLLIFISVLIMFLTMGQQRLLTMDLSLGISRDIWMVLSPWPPLSWSQLFLSFIHSFGTGFLVLALSVITTIYLAKLTEN